MKRCKGVGSHNDERRVIEFVLAVDVDTRRDQFLRSFEITMSAGGDEFVKLGTLVEGILISEHSTLDKGNVVLELGFQLELSKNHGGKGCGSNLRGFKEKQMKPVWIGLKGMTGNDDLLEQRHVQGANSSNLWRYHVAGYGYR